MLFQFLKVEVEIGVVVEVEEVELKATVGGVVVGGAEEVEAVGEGVMALSLTSWLSLSVFKFWLALWPARVLELLELLLLFAATAAAAAAAAVKL